MFYYYIHKQLGRSQLFLAVYDEFSRALRNKPQQYYKELSFEECFQYKRIVGTCHGSPPPM